MLGKLIIILGYTLGQQGDIQPILQSRLEKSLSIYESQDTVLVCGNMPPRCLVPARCETMSEAHAMKLYLVKNGIPKSKIYKEEKSTTTFGNAFYGAEIIENLSPQEIVIIANGFHYPLIKYSFNKVLGNRYPYTFEIISDSILAVAPSELERWKEIVREMSSTYNPMLFKNVVDGDREELRRIIEGPIPSEFKAYVQKLLKLNICENIKELITG
ncbi:MAG: YdcF family protein [Chlamydiota bacterium]